MNAIRHDAMAKLADACADDAEILALSVMRMLMAGYATGDVLCWDLAYAGAERHLGAEAGGRFVAGLTTLSRAVRAEHRGEWSFMPATCCRVTSDEEAVLRLIAMARGGEAHAVRQAASDVSGSPVSPHLEGAAYLVARLLNETAGRLNTSVAARAGGAARIH